MNTELWIFVALYVAGFLITTVIDESRKGNYKHRNAGNCQCKQHYTERQLG